MGKPVLKGRAIMWIGVGLSTIVLFFPPWQFSQEVQLFVENLAPETSEPTLDRGTGRAVFHRTDPGRPARGRAVLTKPLSYHPFFLPPELPRELNREFPNYIRSWTSWNVELDMDRLWPPLAVSLLITAAGMVSVLASKREQATPQGREG